MTICFQEMIDGISCIANYEMNVSRIFYFLKMSEYEKFFERLALRHYGFLDEMISSTHLSIARLFFNAKVSIS